MALLVGIDEAGFGPTLGPLVVSGTAFRVPDERRGQSLWTMLREVCSSKPSAKGRRLIIADSKRLYGSQKSLRFLERGVLVMLAVSGKRPRSVVELIEGVAEGVSGPSLCCPWYTTLDVPLPVDRSVGDIGTRANAVRQCAAHQNVSFLGAVCELLLEGEFNRTLSRTRNKASVLIGLVLRIIERTLALAPDPHICICVDRLGGRTRYREVLMTAFPSWQLKIMGESQTCSAYQLQGPDRSLEIQFAVDGESHHLPVALSSMFSKYLRELYMQAFNRYWLQKAKDLRPTAGYYADAQRWLRDAQPLLKSLAFDNKMLVRER